MDAGEGIPASGFKVVFTIKRARLVQWCEQSVGGQAFLNGCIWPIATCYDRLQTTLSGLSCQASIG